MGRPAAEHRPGDEQKLPGERIEIPDMALRIGRHRDVEDLDNHVENRRGRQHPQPVAPHAEQNRREDHQHHDIQRQDVEKSRLELEQQRLDHRDVGLAEKLRDAHLFIVHRVLEGGRGIGHLGDEQDEHEDVRDIKLPGPPQHLRSGIERAFAGEAPAIDQGCGKPGYEDEDLRRVEKGNRLQREIAQDVLRNVIDKY